MQVYLSGDYLESKHIAHAIYSAQTEYFEVVWKMVTFSNQACNDISVKWTQWRFKYSTPFINILALILQNFPSYSILEQRI